MECADRKLDPLTTNLVVADQSRTDKTICLAVSPALKASNVREDQISQRKGRDRRQK